jgi:hypothetical protein
MIDDEVVGNGFRRRWTLPVGVAAAVTATGVAAAIAFGGGATKGAADRPQGPAAGGVPTTTVLLGKPLPADLAANQQLAGVLWVAAGQACEDQTSGGAVPKVDPGYMFVGKAGNASGFYCLEQPISAARPTSPATPPVIALGSPTPIPADQIAAILKSCLGDDAAKVTPVVAEHTAIATTQQDGIVVARDGQGRYVVCHVLGTAGRSSSQPPYHTLDQQPGVAGSDQIQDIDSGGDLNTPGQKTQLTTSVGHYGTKVARVTISYGTNPAEYPALMKDGVFFLSVSTAAQPDHPEATNGYVHAYDASGKVLYNGVTDAPGK